MMGNAKGTYSMKSREIPLLLTLIVALLPILPCNADEIPAMSTGYVSRGSTRVAFQYPAGCEIVDEGSIGTLVYLTESDYISLMIPKGKMSGTAAVHDYILSCRV